MQSKIYLYVDYRLGDKCYTVLNYTVLLLGLTILKSLFYCTSIYTDVSSILPNS